MFFDTHTHLDQEEFDDIRPQVLERADEARVESLVAVGTTAPTSEKCVALAQEYKGVYAAVGIQPNYVAEAGQEDWHTITKLVQKPRVVAIGETGLDRYWDYAPFSLQQDYFDRHLRLSQQLDIPFVVHMRDCDDEILVMLREARQRGTLRGIMHSFTGNVEMAAECVDLGLHISFAGMVTFKKSQVLRDCAATVPAERLLIETDAPYLSPEPVRGQRPNEPSFVVHTAECLARIRGVSLDALAKITTRNACELFRIKS